VPNQLQYITHSAWPVAALALDYEHLVVALMGARQKGHRGFLTIFSFSAHASHTH
jgi:hypothetical protein